MEQHAINSTYHFYKSIEELPHADQDVILAARQATEHAYAPYSGFYVGAAVLLANDELISGSNQENASSPVGNCAERVTLSAASAQHPGVAIKTLAISSNSQGRKREPISPCGMCRQTILEYEERFRQPINILLTGEDDTVIQLSSVEDLLPLPFTIPNRQS